MTKRPFLRIAAAAAVLLFAAVLVHSFRAVPSPQARAARLELPPPPPPEPPPVEAAARAPEPGRAVEAPERLLPFLEKLGRARLVRDRKMLDALRRNVPPVFEEDFGWIRGRLRGELLAAAGAAELLAGFRRQDAVGDLAPLLSGPISTLLKDVVIDTLAALGGDGAAAALVTAARNDPDEGVRARAATALGAFAGPESYAVLSGALRDPSAVVRSAAATALSHLPSRAAVELLLGAMAAEADPRIQADLAIGAWTAGGEPWREVVVRAILARPAVLGIVEERRRGRDDSRYRHPWDRAFFDPGQAPVPRPPSARRIGIIVETGPDKTLPEVAARLFAVAPLDRYRDWFRFRRADEFPASRVYDSYGNPAGDAPYDDLDGTVFLRYRDPKAFDPGILGYTRGCESVVSDVSVIHEFGHAFARLGDEYADGSTADAANLARLAPASWDPLIRSSLLPEPLRRDKAFLVPSADCHMANRPQPTRFCPVCQLELHARMWELAGSPLPW